MTAQLDDSERVILHICVTDLPGSPQNRHNFLGDLFCRQVLGRDFNSSLQTSARDHIHIPADFDTETPVRRWFIIDLNVHSRLTRDEVKELPHRVYAVSHQDDRWLFIPKEKYVEKAKNYCTTYFWGGRQEQDWIDKMNEEGKTAQEFLTELTDGPD